MKNKKNLKCNTNVPDADKNIDSTYNLFILVFLKVVSHIMSHLSEDSSNKSKSTRNTVQAKNKTFMKTTIIPLFCLSLICSWTNIYSQSKPIKPDSVNKKSDEIKVQIQSYTIGRNHNGDNDFPTSTNYNELAHSIVFTLDYKSPTFYNLSINGQYLGGFSAGQSGSYDGIIKDHLANGNINVVNQLFLQYDFSFINQQKASLTVGRKNIDSPFTPSYNIRQKDQSYEAIELNIPTDSSFSISLGHIHRFSDWKPDAQFQSISELNSPSHKSSGIQFLQLNCVKNKNVRWLAYNFFGANLYNTFGANLSWRFYKKDSWSLAIQSKYVNQMAIGEYKKSITPIQANVVQVGLRLIIKKFSIEPGILHALGNGNNNTLQTPFQASLIVKEPLFEIDFGLEGGNTSYFIETNLQGKKWKLYGLWFRTQSASSGFTEEFDLIGKYKVSSKFYTALKIGLIHYNNVNGSDNYVTDGRAVIGYQF